MAKLRRAVRSGVFWQVVAGFALGTLGTLAAHAASAEREPSGAGAAHAWRIAR